MRIQPPLLILVLVLTGLACGGSTSTSSDASGVPSQDTGAGALAGRLGGGIDGRGQGQGLAGNGADKGDGCPELSEGAGEAQHRAGRHAGGDERQGDATEDCERGCPERLRGILESAETNNAMVGIKLVAILIFVFAVIGFIHPSNWHPFMPNGWSGVLTGGSIIFFTYIGFDSVSTAAEECHNPQRDLPIGIIATLVVCTVLYIAVAVCLTGLVPWQSMVDDGAPVVNALKKLSVLPGAHSLHWVRMVVLIGAIMGMLSSILVYQLGQSRVWFSMSRDGLLPKVFSNVHPIYRTPAFSTWVAGIVVAIPSGLFDIGTLADLSNIGTLFAFVLVSIGVIVLRIREPERRRGFRVPFGPVIPVLSVLSCFLLMAGLPIITWYRFLIWLVIGLVIYFLYSRHRSEFAGQ